MKYKVLKKGTRWNTGKRVYVLDDPVQKNKGIPKALFDELKEKEIITGVNDAKLVKE